MSKKNLKKSLSPQKSSDISEKIVADIRSGELKIKPKYVYWLGSLLLFLGTLSATIVGIFSVAVIRFLTRQHGPMGEVRFAQLLGSIPWWLPVVMVLSAVTGILLIKKAEFGYKLVTWQLLLIGFVAISLGGLLADQIGLTNYIYQMGRRYGGNSRTIKNIDNTMMRGQKFQNQDGGMGGGCRANQGSTCRF